MVYQPTRMSYHPCIHPTCLRTFNQNLQPTALARSQNKRYRVGRVWVDHLVIEIVLGWRSAHGLQPTNAPCSPWALGQEPRPSYQKLRSLKATGKAENGECRFTTVTETRVVKSILFGKDVEYGLGHRVRTMDLGVYPHDTSTSRLFWSEEYMQIIASTPGVSLGRVSNS